MLTFDPSIRSFPVLDAWGRVAFEVRGGSGMVLAKLYNGESAPIATYINNLKALRWAIFPLKKIDRSNSPHGTRR